MAIAARPPNPASAAGPALDLSTPAVSPLSASPADAGPEVRGTPAASGTHLEGVRGKVFRDRYSLKDANGAPTEAVPEAMWARVARGIAATETGATNTRRWEAEYRRVLQDFKFVPGGRILTGAGSEHDVTYYNCFVLPSPEDSRGGIMDALKLMVEIQARGGGVGLNLSTLRPRGAYVKGVNGTSSGPVAWAGLFAYATHEVIQQGGSRRGALMLMLDDDHPDVEEFVTVKQDLTKLNGANLSVCVSDAFMAAVEADAPWPLRWRGEIQKTLPARDLWARICESAHASGEPGLVFLERYQKLSNTAYFETLISVNPCGEQGLPAWGVCNLGSMNLSAYASGPVGGGVFDFAALAADTAVAVRFLDSVVDATGYFFPENEAAQKRVRRTGLGTMGLADALLRLGLRYGSVKAEPFVERVYTTLRDAAYAASAALAGEKGAFPAYDPAHYLERPFVRALPEAVKRLIRRHGIRNAVLLTQAPTGTTSLVAGASSGIEPVYDFALVRRDRTGESVMYHPLFAEWRASQPADAPVPDYFVAANDLTPDEHVRVQALIQRYTDSSISKTVNAPHSHTVAQVQELYTKAYQYGCKGVTYFRDGCRLGVLSHLEPDPLDAPNTLALAPEPTTLGTLGTAAATVHLNGSGAWPNGATLTTTANPVATISPVARRRPCPECGQPTLADAEGCEHCPACGYAACAL